MILTFLLTLFSFLFIAVSPATAQTAGLSITPPVVEILLAPNKKITQAFQLTNQGESSQFVANLHAVTPDGQGGHVTVDPTPLDPATIPLVAALANSDRKLGEPFSLASGESTQLILSLESAELDSNQDVYLALVISTASPSTTRHQSSSIPGISSLILVTLTPDGSLPLQVELEGFDLPLLHDSSSPLFIEALVKNLSPTMLRVGGTLTVASPRNSNSESIKIYPNLALGLTSRTLQAWEDPPDPALNQTATGTPPAAGPLVYQPRWYNLGPHRFTLTLTTLGGSQITKLEKVVWLLPLRAVLVTFLLALIIISLLIFARKDARPPASTPPSSS